MIRYRQDDVQAVGLRWKRMKIFGTESSKASVEDLALVALTGRFPSQRLAAVAELVSRLKNERSAREMLDRLPLTGGQQKQISTQSVDGSES
jgi:hypothetical protein